MHCLLGAFAHFLIMVIVHRISTGERWLSVELQRQDSRHGTSTNVCKMASWENVEAMSVMLRDELSKLSTSIKPCKKVFEKLRSISESFDKTVTGAPDNISALKKLWLENEPGFSKMQENVQSILYGVENTSVQANTTLLHLEGIFKNTIQNLQELHSNLSRDYKFVTVENKDLQERLKTMEAQAIEKALQLSIREGTLKNNENEYSKLHSTINSLFTEQHTKLKQREDELRTRELSLSEKSGIVIAQEKSNRAKENDLRTREDEVTRRNQSVIEREREIRVTAYSLYEQEWWLKIAFLVVIAWILFCAAYWAMGRSSSKPATRHDARIRGSPNQDQQNLLDLCHLSLTRERNLFFRNVLMQRLAENNMRPRAEYLVLNRPQDFNKIPPAKCYVVHWTSQRMSIFSDNWTHRGLLRALDNSPHIILVYDSEHIDVLPNGQIYDANFGQVETEPELREAVRENRLITYRANERFNAAQDQALKNWVNANTSHGDPLRV